MKIIGITGGIGSGKTAVLNILKSDYGAFVMEADALAHCLMKPGQMSYNDIVNAFGQDILMEDGAIDRQKLGQVVFNDEEKLKILNSITHPNVKKAILSSIEEKKLLDVTCMFSKQHSLYRMDIWIYAMRCGLYMRI